jgi:hypothetical protein
LYLAGIMPPRRGGRERNVGIEELRLELKHIQARMEAMETTQRRELEIGDVSKSEDTSFDEEA